MTRIFRSPSKYVQGAGEFSRLHEHLISLGQSALFIISENGKNRCESAIDKGLYGTGFRYDYYIFQGECCQHTVNEVADIAKKGSFDMIIGVGGGKVLDTAKGAAYYANMPVAILPTVASSDAPCSALSVLYNVDGVFDKYLFLSTSANLVVVDSEVIVQSPSRLLVAGMGDALSTFFEARAVREAGKNNQVGGKPTIAAFALAKTCHDILISNGCTAKIDAENGVCSPAVEDIIEVNTYLSSVGFESGGLAAAHALQKGLTILPELHHIYHGEKVAFCTLVQVVMEKSSKKEVEEVFSFCKNVGLPVSFRDMGIDRPKKESLMKVAEKACGAGSTIFNMPFRVNASDVCEAMITADSLCEKDF